MTEIRETGKKRWRYWNEIRERGQQGSNKGKEGAEVTFAGTGPKLGHPSTQAPHRI